MGETMDRKNFFKEVIERVPAYKKFAEENNFDSNTVWEKIPLIDKHSYLLKYELSQLCWDGDLSKAHLIGASSGFGKSGTIFWPKRPEDEKNYIKNVETMLVENYHIDKKKTLIIVSLAFGTWIGGMQLAAGIRTLATENKYPITCATPGLNITEAVEIYKIMKPHIEQTLIITNPSNITLFYALLKRIKFEPDGTIFFPVVGEYVSEAMRIKVIKNFGHKEDSPFVVWTGYGSADTGDVGVETESTMKLRRYIFEKTGLSNELFNTTDTPMIFELSSKVFVEIINNEIIVTKNQLIPLVRYNTKDCGGLLNKSDLLEKIPENILEKLPEKMLYVFGRTGDSIIFYGTNLSIGDMQAHFLSLDRSFYYGGLFQVSTSNIDGIPVFTFIFYLTEKFDSDKMVEKYKKALLEYLLNSSNEFKFKFNHLNSIVGEKLITVKLKDIKSLEGKLKHKYIIEE